MKPWHQISWELTWLYAVNIMEIEAEMLPRLRARGYAVRAGGAFSPAQVRAVWRRFVEVCRMEYL